MKTLTDFAGFTQLKKVSMTAGSPNNDGMMLEHDAAFKDSYIATKDMWGYPPEAAASMLKPASYQAAAEAREHRSVALLTEDDFANPVEVKHFRREEYGDMRYGGPGGYPYRETRYVPDGSRSLTQFVREWTGFPHATWAMELGGQDSMHPPYLHVFVSKKDELTTLTENGQKPDMGALLQGKVQAAADTEVGRIEEDEDELVIGSLRLKPGDVMHFRITTTA